MSEYNPVNGGSEPVPGQKEAPPALKVTVDQPEFVNYMGPGQFISYYRGEEFPSVSGGKWTGSEYAAKNIREIVEKLASAELGTAVAEMALSAGTTEKNRDFRTMQRFFTGYLAALAEEANQKGFNLQIVTEKVFGDEPKTVVRLHAVEQPDTISKVEGKTYTSFEDAPQDPSLPTFVVRVTPKKERYTGGTWGSVGGGGAFIGYDLKMTLEKKEAATG